jgi:transcriptional regulator with XRE-family HTH domain
MLDILLEKLAYARNIGARARNSGVAVQKGRTQTSGMTIHKRIKKRRTDLEMSMQTLAELCGYSSWQTVQQWEAEDGTAPKRTKMPLVAAALGVTEEWLMTGRTQPKDNAMLKLTELSPLESQLILLYRSLSGSGRDELLAVANDLANKTDPDKPSKANPFKGIKPGAKTPSKSKG